MFGKNKIRKQSLGDGTSLEVVDIFHTIQGEGPFAGQPAIFVRLAGCNLRCWFCDTDFESNAVELPLDSIWQTMKDVRGTAPTNLVVLTGGEPFRQNIVMFCHMLLHLGFTVQIETAGTLWLRGMSKLFFDYPRIHLVCSPKTPRVNADLQLHCKHWKYILREGETSAEDGLPVVSTQVKDEPARLARPPSGTGNVIWVQACDEYLSQRNEVNLRLAAEVAMKHGYRLSFQLHKAVGLP